MSYELKPRTEAGKRFVAAAEGIQDTLRSRAGDADQASTINADNFNDMRAAGITTAFVPEACGGFGLTSVHDWMAGMSRLGRGDGSVAIAMNMHLAVSRGMAGAWAAAKASDNAGLADLMEGQFAQIASGDMYLCATATEPGTDNLHPFTEATRVDDGWRINGTKIFVTGSPVASHVAMNLRIRDEGEDGADVIGSIMMPLATLGIEQQDDWLAMGMRASGSQSIKFNNVIVPEHMVRPMGPWGVWSTNVLMNRNLSNLPLLGVFLGIAEHAYELALEAAAKKPKADKPRNADRAGIQHMIGEMEIALSTVRAMVGQMGLMVDEFLAEFDGKELPLERAHELLKDHQSMKWVVNRNAIEIVNRSMDIVGGGGFMDAHPLSRLYRDVRAGPFMQPYSPTEAREYGCHLCELEIDPDTGTTEFISYVVVDDVGTVINPLLLKGQIHGGVSQGLGQAMCEDLSYDAESGQLITASFLDYCMPRADDMCSIEVVSNGFPSPTNPLGIKGAGEAGCVGALPCVQSALIDALSPLGITDVPMPATPYKLWEVIQAS